MESILANPFSGGTQKQTLKNIIVKVEKDSVCNPLINVMHRLGGECNFNLLELLPKLI